MEHPCYRCQADIPENTAFCPHCGAPQIRVVPAESEAPPQPTAPESPGQVLPPPSTPSYWTQGAAPYPTQSTAIQWNLAWKGALMAGLGAAVLSAIPFVSIGCCLWMLGAGMLAVRLYRKQVPGLTLTPGMGMRIGALAGIFGFAANAIVSTISFVLLRNSGDFRHALQEQMEKQMAGNSDPKVQQMMENMLNWMSTPQGAATMIVLFLVIFGIVFVLLCAAGGALGASMFGQRREFR